MANVNVEITAQIDKFQKNLDEAQASLKSFGASIQRLAIPAAAVSLAISAIGVSAVKTFAELEGVKNAFDRLDNPNLLDNLRRATKGTTSDFELMKNAVQASNFKLPVEQLASLMEFASRRAKDTGESVDYLVNSIVTGIGRKSPLILDNLGISATELKKQLNGVSMEAASIADVTEAVGRIASAELLKMGKDSDTLAEKFLRIKTVFTNEMGGMGETISKALSPAIDAIENLALKFQALSPEMKNMIVYVGAGIAAFTGLIAAAGAIITIAPLVAAAWRAIGGPIALVATGIAVAAALIIANWDKVTVAVRTFAAELLKNIGTVLGGMASLANAVGANNVYALLSAAQMGVVNTSKRITKALSDEKAALFEASNAAYADIAAKKILGDEQSRLADGQARLASGLNSVASGAARAGAELLRLRAIQQVLNGKELTGTGVEQKKTIGSLDRGVTIPIGMPNIQGIIPQVKADAQTLAGEFNDTLSGTLTQGLNTAIVDIASGIGEALASGGNLIDSLGAVFLGSMGGILKQLGEMAIQVGIGVLAVKKALQTLNPFVAIAAGVALVAIGSAFSSSARSLGGSMGGQGSQGTQTFTSGSVVEAAQYSEPKWEVMERNGDLMARISYGNNRRGR
jgi:hypothetical protein